MGFYSFTNRLSLQKTNYCDLTRQSSTLQRIKKRLLCLMCSKGGRRANVSDLNQYSPNNTHISNSLTPDSGSIAPQAYVTARTSTYTRKPQRRIQTSAQNTKQRLYHQQENANKIMSASPSGECTLLWYSTSTLIQPV